MKVKQMCLPGVVITNLSLLEETMYLAKQTGQTNKKVENPVKSQIRDASVEQDHSLDLNRCEKMKD